MQNARLFLLANCISVSAWLAVSCLYLLSCDRVSRCSVYIDQGDSLGQLYILVPNSIIPLLAFDFVHVFSRFLLLYSGKMAWVMIVSSLWMGHAMYFSLGNSNSLASVDISAGYVGLEDFVPSLMLILTYFSTYCGPCLWMFSGVLSVVRNAEDFSR